MFFSKLDRRRSTLKSLHIETLEGRLLMAGDVMEALTSDMSAEQVVMERTASKGSSAVEVDLASAQSVEAELSTGEFDHLHVSPEQIERLEQLLVESFPELANLLDNDPTADLWSLGIEKPETGTEYVDLVKAVLTFGGQDFSDIPSDSDGFAAWLVDQESQGAEYNYDGMNKAEGDDPSDDAAVDTSTTDTESDAGSDTAGDSGSAWDTFVNWLGGASGGAVSEVPKSNTGKAAGGIAGWFMTILSANTSGNNFDGAVDNKSSEVYGWATFKQLSQGQIEKKFDDATKLDSSDTDHYGNQGSPDDLPAEPELDETSKAILNAFPPISQSTKSLYEGIEKDSRYWSDKTPHSLTGSVYDGVIPIDYGIDAVDKPATDWGRETPDFTMPDDGVTDPPPN